MNLAMWVAFPSESASSGFWVFGEQQHLTIRLSQVLKVALRIHSFAVKWFGCTARKTFGRASNGGLSKMLDQPDMHKACGS